MGARVLVRLVAMALIAPTLAATAQVEWLGPYLGPLPGTEPDGVSITLVRDRRTGSPLAGVTVRCYRESIDPRVSIAPFLGESRTDAFGLVSLPVKDADADSHWVFEKAGHAVRESYGHLAGPIVELSPGRELHGRLFDPMGRPACDIPVQLFLGCGHSPIVRRARTDALGRFTMRDVAPRFGTLWIPAPGLAAHNVTDPAGTVRQPFVVHTHPGVVLTGMVIDADGKPIPNVVVRSAQETRGPTATTGPNGRFELSGYDPSAGLRLCGPDGREIYAGDGTFDPNRSPRLVYPLISEDDDEEGASVPLRVRVVDAENGKPVSDAVLKLHEAGRERIHWIDLGSGDDPEAPPGEYLLSAGDTWSSHFAPPRPITLAKRDGTEIRIEARRRPILVIEAAGFPNHRDAHLEVVLAGESMLIPGDRGAAVHVPADVEAVVRAAADGLVRHFPVGRAADGRRHVKVIWPRTKRIVVDFGRRFDLSLRHRKSTQTGDNVLDTHAAGPVVLVVADRALGEQEVRVEVPDRPGAEVRVAAAALRRAGLIRVVLANGSPLAKAALRIDGELEHLDEQGRLESWRVKAGAAVRIQRDGHVTLRRVLAGPGPEELRWGTARLEFEGTDASAFVAYVDGDLFPATDGHVAVAGLDPGPHIVIVATRGRPGRALRVTLREGETRVVRVALPRRP